MKMIALYTASITEAILCENMVIVKQKKNNGYVKNWFCQSMTQEEYQDLINDINTKNIITIALKGKSE